MPLWPFSPVPPGLGALLAYAASYSSILKRARVLAALLERRNVLVLDYLEAIR